MIKGMFVFSCGLAVGTAYGILLGFKIADDSQPAPVTNINRPDPDINPDVPTTN